MTHIQYVTSVYMGSDGEATKALYARLQAIGPIGIVALNLFRAQKCSERAKAYRGGIRGQGSFKGMAYDRKQWSMDNLARELEGHGQALEMRWGWKRDPVVEFHPWVMYVDLPGHGQVSFHTGARGAGPDYVGDWDGARGLSPGRIQRFVAGVLERAEVAIG